MSTFVVVLCIWLGLNVALVALTTWHMVARQGKDRLPTRNRDTDSTAAGLLATNLRRLTHMRSLHVLFQCRPSLQDHWEVVAVHQFIDEDGIFQLNDCGALTIAVVDSEAEVQRMCQQLNDAVAGLPVRELGRIPVGPPRELGVAATTS